MNQDPTRLRPKDVSMRLVEASMAPAIGGGAPARHSERTPTDLPEPWRAR